MVKNFLSQRGIAYEERDVSRNQAYARELVQNTGQMGVPVTVFDDEIVVGFDQKKLAELADKMAKPAPEPRPSFGAAIADAVSVTSKAGKPIKFGAYVGNVKQGSPAQKMGLRPGDIITWINKINITNAGDMERVMGTLKKDSNLSITYMRGDEALNGEAVLQ